MRLRSFTLAGTWDRIAAAQLLCIVMAIYKDRPDAARALVGADAHLIAYQPYNATTWPPAYMVFRESPTRWWIVWEGTTNLGQLGGHIRGAFGVPGSAAQGESGPLSGIPNGAWLQVWRQQWPEIRALLPTNLAGVRVHFSGHSYGAALAIMSASYLMRDEPAVTAEVMTFGSPKVWTAGYAGPLPPACWLIRSANDPVAQVPPPVIGMFAADIGTPYTLLVPTLLRWSHFGTEVVLGADGSSDPNAPLPGRTVPGLTAGLTQEHGTRNYFARVRLSWELQGSPP